MENRRSHIRTTRPRLHPLKGWKWRVIVIDPRGYVDWDDYHSDLEAKYGAQWSIDRLVHTPHSEVKNDGS